MTEKPKRTRGANFADLSAKYAALQGEHDALKLQTQIDQALLTERLKAVLHAAQALAELPLPKAGRAQGADQ